MSGATEAGFPPGLRAAFDAYERALMTDDTDTLNALFAPGPDTLRGDAAGVLVGHDAIAEFRSTRGGAPQRRIVSTHVRTVDESTALVVAVTELGRGGRGQQTQLWTRSAAAGWQVSVAHVSVPPPAFDTRIWRALGDPLVPATVRGPLHGESVAVKDVYAVAGQRIGAGNPAHLAAAEIEVRDADAIAMLLAAGADLRGIARTDEFAYSLAGANVHYGTPPNAKAPYRISGGSSSGSAAAVSLGHASIGLGTDTAGSIRVPAAYQGLYGLRTTHGAVSREGLLPLAPSFDTVGWLTRSAALLRDVGRVLLPASDPHPPADVVLLPSLLGLASPDVANAVSALLPGATREAIELDLPSWSAAFRDVQAFEAWRCHGPWLRGRLDSLGPDVRTRFEYAAAVTEGAADAARAVLVAARTDILDLVGDRVLLLPAAPTTAPVIGTDLDAVRAATLQLTCLAGIAGLPALVLPVATGDGLPAGACLLAAPGRDHDLLELAVDLCPASTVAASR